jgi:threonine/homoserine/homoserine lactone efflux protein
VGQGIGEVLTFAIGIAISPVPIIAVILMLFSQQARVNGPVFLVGWVVGLAVVSSVVYVVSDESNAATSTSASDTISWGKIVLGVLFLLLAERQWRNRPGPDAEPEMPKWMASVDTLAPAKALGLAVVLAVVNPKNLLLTVGAAAGLAQLGISTTDAIVSLVVFVVVASLTLAGPVVYYLVRGEKAKVELDELKGWLAVHNAAVMTVLFVVFGVDLIAKGIPPLTA